jgi:hypothetical protein
VRQSEPSELGQVLSRHNGRILVVGWFQSMGLVFAAFAVSWGVLDAGWLRTAATAAIGAVALFLTWRRWNQRATVHEGGVVWTRGRRREVVRWQDVDDVAAETFNDEYELTVTTRDGRTLVFNDSVANVQQLHAYFLNATRGREQPAPTSSSSSRW